MTNQERAEQLVDEALETVHVASVPSLRSTMLVVLVPKIAAALDAAEQRGESRGKDEK